MDNAGTRYTVAGLVLGLSLLLLLPSGCGKKETGRGEEKAVSRKRAHEKGDPYRYLSPVMVETLVVKKGRYGITRDEYWLGEGGVLANESFEVWYPPGRMAVTHAFFLFDLVMEAKGKLGDTLGVIPRRKVVIVCTKDLSDYQHRTKRDWWHYAKVDVDTIVFQPVHILYSRRIAGIAIPHEYYQWAVSVLSGGRAPRWLEEGLASHLSEEEKISTDSSRSSATGSSRWIPGRWRRCFARRT